MASTTEIILTIFYTLIFLWIIRKWNFFQSEGISKNLISVIFLLKLMFGFLVFLVYYFYYGNNRMTGDIFRFYDDSLVIYQALKDNPIYYLRIMFGINIEDPVIWQYIDKMNFWTKEYDGGIFNDNRTIIRANAIFNLFSFGYYHVHTVFMCFLSLVGLVGVFKTFEQQFQRISLFLIMGTFFIPSLLFWGSGVSKEGIAILAVGMFTYFFFQLVNQGNYRWKVVLLLLSAFALLCYVKIYIIIALIPAVLGYVIAKKWKKPIVSYTLVLGICITGAVVNWKGPRALDIVAKLKLKQEAFIHLTKIKETRSVFELTPLEYHPVSIFKASPQAIVNTTFRPFLWESKSPFMLFNSMENMVLFLFAIACIAFAKKWKEIDQNKLLFMVTFVGLMYLFIGLVTPVSGAIVRYKIIGWPFFVILFLLIVDQNRVSKILDKGKSFRVRKWQKS